MTGCASKSVPAARTYCRWIDDDHYLSCVEQLLDAYDNAKADLSFKKFNERKVDPYSMLVVSRVEDAAPDALVAAEVARQLDKALTGALGTFHECLIGGLDGFTRYAVGHGYDVKADDDSLFGEVKSKHNTMNDDSSKSVHAKLCSLADAHPGASCYLIEIISTRSRKLKWRKAGETHDRVYKISADRFYAEVTGRDDAFFEVFSALHIVLEDALAKRTGSGAPVSGGAYDELKKRSATAGISELDLLARETFSTYSGFAKYEAQARSKA